jgi:hypothetical protein
MRELHNEMPKTVSARIYPDVARVNKRTHRTETPARILRVVATPLEGQRLKMRRRKVKVSAEHAI